MKCNRPICVSESLLVTQVKLLRAGGNPASGLKFARRVIILFLVDGSSTRHLSFLNNLKDKALLAIMTEQRFPL